MNARSNIGLVLASLHTGASLTAWPGVAREAERAGVNLFCFPGGRLGLREGYEATRNAIYDLAALAPLDGILLWASSLCGEAGTGPSIDGFLDRYRDIPVTSLSAGVSGVPIVTFDYYGGMRDLVLHAVKTHGFRKLAFIRGPSGHPGASERYCAFIDSLRELSIEADPRLSTSPFPWDSGREAALELLDGRCLMPGRDFEALIASSDLLALAAMRELQSRGYRVPEDVAVMGMNNGVESRIAAPPLTTVDCPFAELGAMGLKTLLDDVASRGSGRGVGFPSSCELKVKLVVRRSCGCPLGASSAGDWPDLRGPESLEKAIAAEVGLPLDLARDWVTPLVEAWEASTRGRPDLRFLDIMGRILDRAARAGMDLFPWQGAISILRRSALRRIGAAGREAMEDITGRARVLVAEAAERAHSFRTWERDRVDLKLRDLDHDLLMARDARSIGEILRLGLPALGIRSAYLCRYEDVGAAGLASLATGFRDGEVLEASSPFPAADLLPRDMFPDRRLSYIVEPLFFHDNPIGYALFEIGDEAGAIYERLRDSVSNALRSILLFQHIEDARARAERADGIKTRLLTNVTHELRAPVDMILRGASRLLEEGRAKGVGSEAAPELERIMQGAEHERRLIGDLLDFSRAEIDELDIERAPIDPEGAIREAFALFAARAREGVEWRLDLPERLPVVMADIFRLKQILMNLLSNAEKLTHKGYVTLSAKADPPDLIIRVADTGPGIQPERLPHLFEPFLSAGGPWREGSGGVGLGLSIARHLALLHFGSLEAESLPEGGAAFTLSLPLPDVRSLSAGTEAPPTFDGAETCILLVSSSDQVPPEISAAAAARGLPLRRVSLKEAENGALDRLDAEAIAWDSASSTAEERALFRKIRQRPRLASLPFLLYGAEKVAATFIDKGSDAPRLADALALALGLGSAEASEGLNGDAVSIIAADDDENALERIRLLLEASFPGAKIAVARDGTEAWELLREKKPMFAVLDIAMPGLSGIELVKRMRASRELRSVPAILLTSKVISMEDVRALEGSSRVLLRNKGVLTVEGAAAEASRVASGEGMLPGATSDIAKRAVAFINERFASALTRWQIAEAVNASEDYLSRVFRQELGIAPWEYLTRLRIERAKELLAAGTDSVSSIGARVGFPDQAYFSRVFKKVTGLGPQAYRDSPR
jgi:signal transduction histidine kinase/DNA-binding LacI/PurR family transcriptional regulator/AraC-like DNA-binding protein